MTLNYYLNEFLKDRTLNGCLPSSVKNYRATLSLFVNAVGSSLHVSDLTYGMVSDYILTLLNGSIKRNTARSYIRNIKIYLSFIDGFERLSFNPKRIKKPREEIKDIIIYTSYQWEDIKKSCKTYIYWITLRNVAILTCIFDSGIRKKEVCSIRLPNFHSDGSRVYCMVSGKGLKEREVFFGKASLEAIEKYKEACPFVISDYLFLTKAGTPVTGNTVSQFTYDIEKKLPFRFSAHMLRHNYATRVCQAYILKYGKADIELLSIYLGHESEKTTKRYIHCAMKLNARQRALSLFDENLFSLGTEALAV